MFFIMCTCLFKVEQVSQTLSLSLLPLVSLYDFTSDDKIKLYSVKKVQKPSHCSLCISLLSEHISHDKLIEFFIRSLLSTTSSPVNKLQNGDSGLEGDLTLNRGTALRDQLSSNS